VKLVFCLGPEYLISGYHGLHFNKTLKPSIMIAAFMPGAILGDSSVYPAEFIENM